MSDDSAPVTPSTVRIPWDRIALIGFVAYVAIAYPLIVFHYGKNEWFIHDDWNFIVGNVLRNVFTPVEHHWSTLPILIYRLYYRTWGANYFPFLATVAALHLAVVCLLRVVMLRAGVRSWLASVVAAELVLFGPGYLSITFAIQITQNLSLAFGLAQMILADHDGRLDRRDAWGLFAGLLGLMSSGLAPVLTIGIGISTLLRRGFRAAAFHTVPLAAIFLVWFSTTQTVEGEDWFRLRYSESQPATFVWHGILQSAMALVHFPIAALALALLVTGGLGLRIHDGGSRRWATTSMPLALLVCAPVYFGVIGLQRSRLGVGYIGWGHHLYTGACFFLPAVACGVEALARRWKVAGVSLAVGLSALIPLNFQNFGANESRNLFLTTTFLQQNRLQILTIAHSRYASEALHLDRSKMVTDGWYSHGLTLGWVIDEARKGRLPRPEYIDPGLNDFAELLYGLTDLGDPPPGMTCTNYSENIEVRPEPGETIVTSSPLVVFNVRRRNASYAKLGFEKENDASAGHVIRAELPDLRLELGPAKGATSFGYCTGSPHAEPAKDTPQAYPMREAIAADPAAMEKLKKAIEADPAAMEALRKAIQQDPAAMEALRKEMAATGAR